MNIKTATDIADWVSSQARPKPPKRTLMVIRPSASDGMRAFTVQYNRLLKVKINSKTAHDLEMAVLHAETAKDLTARINAKVRDSDAIQDSLSRLQLSMYAAADWVRRFAEDRHKVGEYVLAEEKKAGHKVADDIERKVKELFALIESMTKSKTTQEAFNAYSIKWRQQEEVEVKAAAVANQALISQLKKEFAKVEKQEPATASAEKKAWLNAYVTELEDSRKELDPDQAQVVNQVKAWLRPDEEEPPKWRTQGIKTLGPFGIAAAVKIDIEYEYPQGKPSEHQPGIYKVKGPEQSLKPYKDALGEVISGELSPVFHITIKATDPTSRLIRIPEQATFFAFAYPVITGALEVTVTNKSTFDSFLLYGGFVYFDSDMKVIQCNALWVGNQLQMSAPKPLPPTVSQKLIEADRFRDITLPQLSAVQAKKFAWILPGEFPEVTTPHGGWCYLYEDNEVNNYFAIASAESSLGLNKAASLRDFKA